MRSGIGEDFPSRRIADLLVVLHNGIGLKVRLGRTAPFPDSFRERLSGGSKYFGPPKVHLAICSRILKPACGPVDGSSCACFPCGKRRRSLSRDKSRGFILRLYRFQTRQTSSNRVMTRHALARWYNFRTLSFHFSPASTRINRHSFAHFGKSRLERSRLCLCHHLLNDPLTDQRT